MYEMYSKEARRALSRALGVAKIWDSASIETKHMWLGLLYGGTAFVETFGMSAAHILERLEAPKGAVGNVIPPGVISMAPVAIPLSDFSKRVLEYAAEEADSLGHERIETGHLFLGLLRANDPFTEGIMKDFRINLTDARKWVANSQPPAAAPEIVPVLMMLPHQHNALSAALSEVRDPATLGVYVRDLLRAVFERCPELVEEAQAHTPASLTPKRSAPVAGL